MSRNLSITELFYKTYEFTGNNEWTLPKEAYNTPSWCVDSLQQMKATLNSIKGQLGKYPLLAWSDYTKRTDPSGLIISTIRKKAQVELLTQAWCKFYECLNTFPVIPELCINNKQLRTLHLCEAPGAFVSALNYYLYVNHKKIKWTWNASSLNPYYEGHSLTDMIWDDRLIIQTIQQWDFGIDQTGDIRNVANHQNIVNKFGNVDLVTADGSIDCTNDPGEQEHNTHHLHYCETVTALKVLRKGGNFILKLFTMFEHSTISLMYLLNCCFEKVLVSKPCSSKSGNSEVYIVCLNYSGFNCLSQIWQSLLMSYETPKQTALFKLPDIDSRFLVQLQECAKYFMTLQSNQINLNVELFEGNVSNEEWTHILNLQETVAKTYMEKYQIFAIRKNRRLIQKSFRKRPIPQNFNLKIVNVISTLDDDDLIQIVVGRAFNVVQNTYFSCDLSKLTWNNCKLPENLNSDYVVISGTSFDHNISQHNLHKQFFYAVIERLHCDGNFIISGIPLLTRFLVGLTYILSLGFESFVVYKGGNIMFRNQNEFKLYIVKKHLECIAAIYDKLECAKDILEVVSLNVLRKGDFYEAICLYNNDVCV